MRKNMNISVNGQSRVPPGFRFHPTEEELLQYYLRKKVANENIDLDVIFEVDLNKLEPWDIQERCKIGTTPQNDWYFFSHKDKKYPTGTRTNRATAAGFWKATGRDKVIYSNGRRTGMRKTLVFYKGRAPHGQKSDWIMHEYRLDETINTNSDSHVTSTMNGELGQEEGWVVCRIFKKKNHLKALDSPINRSSTTITLESHSASMLDSPSDHDHDHHIHRDDQGALEQIFQFMGAKSQNYKTSFHQVDKTFMKLPSLESPNNSIQAASNNYQPLLHTDQNDVVSMFRNGNDPNSVFNSETGLSDWAALDRFVATHLNGQTSETMASIFSSPSSNNDHDHDHLQLPPLRSSSSSGNKIYHPATIDNNYGSNNEIELWSFTKPSLPVDPLCHVSDAGL